MTPMTPDAAMAAVLDASPYARLLGMTLATTTSDALWVCLPFRPENIGNDQLPALHGGVIGGFMESAALLHLVWLRASTTLPKTIDFSIDYLRTGRAQDLTAACTVTRLGKRVAHVQVTAWQEDPTRPIAVARAHFLLAEEGAPLTH